MSLPTIPLPSSTVEVNGKPVSFRSLSRSEGLKLRQYAGREDEAEVFIVACATDFPEDAVRAFLGSTTFTEAQKLTDAILTFSGLAGDDDPKADTSEPSQTADSTSDLS